MRQSKRNPDTGRLENDFHVPAKQLHQDIKKKNELDFKFIIAYFQH